MPKEEPNLWYVAEGGKTHGPYTSDMVQDRLNKGRFSNSAIVWNDGLTTWQPITLHFAAVKSTSPPPIEPPARPAVRRRRPALIYVQYALLAATIVLFGMVVTGNSASNELDANSFLLIRLVIVGAMAIAGLAAAILWWQYTSIFIARQRVAGLIRASIVICSIAVAITTFAAAVNTPLLYRLQVARESYNHYTVNVDIGTGTLSIEGTIGPGLAREISRQVRSNSAIKTVAINSIGGLVDEAMQIAHEVQDHGGLTTRAWGACNSACLLIFMSGQQRVADRALVFGFHTISAVTPMSGVYNLAAIDAEGAEASKYLVLRGVPEAFISGARALGPAKLFSVPAIQMADSGAVTGLLDDGAPISIARAKWLDVLDGARRAHAAGSLIKFLSTVGELDPASAEKYGPLLWSSLQSGDMAALTGSMQGMVAELAGKAVPAADDGPLADDMKITTMELQYLRQSARWDICNGLLNGKGFGSLVPPARLSDADFTAQAALITSAAQNGWRPREVMVGTSSDGAAIAKTVAEKLIASGMSLQNLDTDPHASCEWTTSLLTAISEKPTPEAAKLFRWLLAGAK